MIYLNLLNKDEQIALNNLKDSFCWTTQQLDYLIACMKFESNLNPKAVNKLSHAVGLIQFMPTTCKSLGITPEEMLALDFCKQLNFVKSYFKPYFRKVKTLNDMYMAILMPKYIGAEDDVNIFSKTIQYKQNIGLDLNKDRIITKSEACRRVQHIYDEGLNKINTFLINP